MVVGDAHLFPGFLTPVPTQFSFQSHRLLFSHASAKIRWKETVRLNRVSSSQPTGHGSNTLTTEPPGRGIKKRRIFINTINKPINVLEIIKDRERSPRFTFKDS